MINKNYRWLFWAAMIIAFLVAAAGILSATRQMNSGPLVINELAASNGTGLVDEDGDHSDWIEIYNRSNTAVNLAGWSLTDDPARPEKWSFPDISLAGDDYLVIFASGKDRASSEPGAILHTNFRLNQQGEFLGLYNILDNKWVDQISPTFPEQFRDGSYGRNGTLESYAYLSQPTPGQPNDGTMAWSGVVEPVTFSQKRGFYDQPFTLKLSTNTPAATILYTTDGSEPTKTNGLAYAGPIEIDRTTMLRAVAMKPGLRQSYVDTHTYLFLKEILTQSNSPPAGFPRFDYEMDPEIVNHPLYKATIEDALTAIPTLSIVTAAENFDIYSKPQERGAAWERPVSVELIAPEGTHYQDGFQINAGIRIQGGWGRRGNMPKHPFRLFFKGVYGATKLEYPLFPDSPVESFDTLVLRAGVNRSYAGKSSGLTVDYRLATYSRDEWLRASQIAMSGAGSHGMFVHLYLNGLYWGLYNLVERPDASFLSAYLGGNKEEWYAMNHGGQISGPDERIDTLLRELTNLSELEPEKRLAAANAYIDIPQFIDYVILNFYAGNFDWSDTNWYAGFHPATGKINFFIWDGELTWLDGADIEFKEKTSSDRLNLFTPAFKALIENEDFKLEFADRLYKHLFNNGVLTDAQARARWLAVNQDIDRAIVAESARWGDARYDSPITQADWFNARDEVLAQMEGNAAKLIDMTRQLGYYPEIDPPRFNQQGGLVTPGFRLELAAPGGTVYYTTDGSNPRQPGPGTGSVAPTAMVYEAPLVITTTTHIKARVLTSRASPTAPPGWSALNEAIFTMVEQDERLRITEIMYNPPGGSNYEFIELKNNGKTAIDLANLFFEGINFTFAPNTPPLAPNEFVVLVNDQPAFAERYPGVSIAGVYNGRLSNAGETITLRELDGSVVISVAYDDENGWPISPDGRGDSLVLIELDGDPNDPKSWRASTNLDGSPGTDDPGQVQPK